MKNSDIIARVVIDYYTKFPELMRSDILHTQEVVSYTRLICVGEEIDEQKTDILECAAWLHDIGCPRSKELYGNSLPVNQQNVGKEVTVEILKELDIFSPEQKEWLANVVGTHHQYLHAVKLGFEPLFEADLIVNLLSGYHKREQAEHLFSTLMTTDTGKSIFRTIIR